MRRALQVIDTGIGTHEAKLMWVDGGPVILGKPYRSVGDDFARIPEDDHLVVWIPQREA